MVERGVGNLVEGEEGLISSVRYRFRPRATKKMTVELAEQGKGQGAFVWPEGPEDYSPYVILISLALLPLALLAYCHRSKRPSKPEPPHKQDTELTHA